LDIGVLGYIGIVQHKEHPPEVFHIPPGTPCICGYSRINSIKFPTSGTDNDSQPKLFSQHGTVRKVIGTYISVFLQLEQWKCQHSSVYVVKAITGLR